MHIIQIVWLLVVLHPPGHTILHAYTDPISCTEAKDVLEAMYVLEAFCIEVQGA